MNIPSECRIASIGTNHAMILPHDPNPRSDGIFRKGTYRGDDLSAVLTIAADDSTDVRCVGPAA